MEENQEVKPNELDDVILPDDPDFKFEDLEIEPQETEDVDTETTPEEESVETNVESVEPDYKPFLEDLSKKVKYLDKEIKFDSIDELIVAAQKGLDYDRQKEKVEELKNSDEMKFLKEIAESQGLDPKEFIRSFKEQQEQQKIEEISIQEGISEEAAKKILKAEIIEKQEKERKEQERKRQEVEEQKKQDMLDFVTQFPNVKVDDIPKEVFIKAESSNLKIAYKEYLLDQKEKELESKLQLQKNKESSPNVDVAEYNNETVKKDPFLEAFNSYQ